MLPPPVPPDSGLSSPPERPPAGPTPGDKDKDEGPDPAYMTLLPDDGSPWGVAPEVATRLAGVAAKYLDYAVKFTCTETVRKAQFDDREAKRETSRNYGYLLERGDGQTIREFRQKMKSDGTVTTSEVNDAEAFPPAYAWVFLFSKASQPYFAYRERGDRFAAAPRAEVGADRGECAAARGHPGGGERPRADLSPVLCVRRAQFVDRQGRRRRRQRHA
jgi:hypothetical protein